MKLRTLPKHLGQSIAGLLQPYTTDPVTADIIAAALRQYEAAPIAAPAASQSAMPALLRKREVAKELAVSVRTVERLITAGSLPTVKVGQRSIRVPATALASIGRPSTVEGQAV